MENVPSIYVSGKTDHWILNIILLGLLLLGHIQLILVLKSCKAVHLYYLSLEG